jgi:hypothetical protein
MNQAKAQPSIDEIKQLVFQLLPQDLLTLFTDIQERLQTVEMMQIAESGFQEWNDPDEDLYSVEP